MESRHQALQEGQNLDKLALDYDGALDNPTTNPSSTVPLAGEDNPSSSEGREFNEDN